MFREYFENKIRPKIDGKLIEYVGPADLQAKNELLGPQRSLKTGQWLSPENRPMK
jgi:hypothetical protein